MRASPLSIGKWTGRISTHDAARGWHDGVHCAQIDQGAAPPDTGGAGPGLAPEGPSPSCVRSFRALPGFVCVEIEASAVEEDGVLKCSALRKPRAVFFTHWMTALTASRPALVTR